MNMVGETRANERTYWSKESRLFVDRRSRVDRSHQSTCVQVDAKEKENSSIEHPSEHDLVADEATSPFLVSIELLTVENAGLVNETDAKLIFIYTQLTSFLPPPPPPFCSPC